MRKHERRANRLDTLLCNILSVSIIAIFLLSCIGTFVTRLHMFQEALNKRHPKLTLTSLRKKDIYSLLPL